MRKIITLLIMALLMAGTADVDAKVNKYQTKKKRQTTTATTKTKTRKGARPTAQQILPPQREITEDMLRTAERNGSSYVRDTYKKALDGDAEKQYSMGLEWSTGSFGEGDRCEALRWFYLAAKQGYADAKAKCHEIQMSIAVDQKAHRPAPDCILPPRLTMTQERLEYIDNKWKEWAEDKTKDALTVNLFSRFNDGVEIYKQALKGDPECQVVMGKFYYSSGEGYDPSEALRWYYLAAKQGYAPTEEILGHAYSYGLYHVKRHPFEAAKWYARVEAHRAEAREKESGVMCLGQMLVDRKITKEEFRIANELAHNDWQKVMKRFIYLSNVAGEANNEANNNQNENNKKYAHFYGTWTSARGTTFTISTGPYLDLRGAGKFEGEWRSNGELHVDFGYPDEINLKYSNGYLYDRDGRMYWRLGQ